MEEFGRRSATERSIDGPPGDNNYEHYSANYLQNANRLRYYILTNNLRLLPCTVRSQLVVEFVRPSLSPGVAHLVGELGVIRLEFGRCLSVADNDRVGRTADNGKERRRDGVADHTPDQKGNSHSGPVTLSDNGGDHNRQKTNQKADSETDHEEHGINHRVGNNGSPAAVTE
jgi:hypothetical protein